MQKGLSLFLTLTRVNVEKMSTYICIQVALLYTTLCSKCMTITLISVLPCLLGNKARCMDKVEMPPAAQHRVQDIERLDVTAILHSD